MSSLPAKHDITIYRGDYWSLSVQITDDNDVPIDLTGAVFLSQIRSTTDDALVLSVITVTPVNLSNGDLLLEIEGSVSGALDFTRKTPVYDVQITLSSKPETYLYGDVTLLKDVSK
jgi:hypothetical protein